MFELRLFFGELYVFLKLNSLLCNKFRLLQEEQLRQRVDAFAICLGIKYKSTLIWVKLIIKISPISVYQKNNINKNFKSIDKELNKKDTSLISNRKLVSYNSKTLVCDQK